MTGRDWITEEEFETAARFLQVVATMRGNLGDYYSELLDEERRWNSDMRGEDYRRIENWLNDIIPQLPLLGRGATQWRDRRVGRKVPPGVRRGSRTRNL